MKYIFLVFIILLGSTLIFAQDLTGPRGYEIWGLAGGKEIWKSILISLPFFIVGILMLVFAGKGNSNEQSKKNSSLSDNSGCIGVILVGIGLFCLLPLLDWVEFIGVSIMKLFFIVAILVLIISGIYKAFTNK